MDFGSAVGFRDTIFYELFHHVHNFSKRMVDEALKMEVFARMK